MSKSLASITRRVSFSVAALSLLSALAPSCSGVRLEGTTTTVEVERIRVEEPKFERLPAADRIIALGDVHGDLKAMRLILRQSGVVDQDDRWVAGNLVFVQTGDVLDRGKDDLSCLNLLRDLQKQAPRHGGRVVLLNGNHEVMNVQGDMRYVQDEAFGLLKNVDGIDEHSSQVSAYPIRERSRRAAMMPGGIYARRLANQDIVAIVGDTLFVHAGLLPRHVRFGLGRLNAEARGWMAGKSPSPKWLHKVSSPVWTRIYSREDKWVCTQLEQTLTAAGAKRMVVGHTVQRRGITSGCNGKIWRIDVGMSASYGGKAAALELRGDLARIITLNH